MRIRIRPLVAIFIAVLTTATSSSSAAVASSSAVPQAASLGSPSPLPWDLPPSKLSCIKSSSIYCQLVRYITSQMRRNSQLLWQRDPQLTVPIFASLVCPKNGKLHREGARCSWDQKPIVKGVMGYRSSIFPEAPGDPFSWIPGTKDKIYFDVWSNVHYGFVGKCNGISESLLLKAQNLSLAGVGEDLGDTEAVKIGIGLATRECAGHKGYLRKFFPIFRDEGPTVSQVDSVIRGDLRALAKYGKVAQRDSAYPPKARAVGDRGSVLYSAGTLLPTDYLSAGRHRLVMQDDGNLVLYRYATRKDKGRKACASSKTARNGGAHAWMSMSGTFYIKSSTEKSVFAVRGLAGSSLKLSRDGVVEIASSSRSQRLMSC